MPHEYDVLRTTLNLARSGRYLTARSLESAVKRALPQCDEAQIRRALIEIGKRGGC